MIKMCVFAHKREFFAIFSKKCLADKRKMSNFAA